MQQGTVSTDITDNELVLRVTLPSPNRMNLYRIAKDVRSFKNIKKVVVTTKPRGFKESVSKEMETSDLLALLEGSVETRSNLRVERKVSGRRRW